MKYFIQFRGTQWRKFYRYDIICFNGLRSFWQNVSKSVWIALHSPWQAHMVTWWRHQMETFSALLALCAGTGEFPTQRPLTRSFDVFFDLRRINGWVNKCKAGDLRRIRPHYDVTVMMIETDSMAVLSKFIPIWTSWKFMENNIFLH